MATSTTDDVRTEPPAMDYGSHQRQYERFLHLTKWFLIHAALLAPAHALAGGVAATATPEAGGAEVRLG